MIAHYGNWNGSLRLVPVIFNVKNNPKSFRLSLDVGDILKNISHARFLCYSVDLRACTLSFLLV